MSDIVLKGSRWRCIDESIDTEYGKVCTVVDIDNDPDHNGEGDIELLYDDGTTHYGKVRRFTPGITHIRESNIERKKEMSNYVEVVKTNSFLGVRKGQVLEFVRKNPTRFWIILNNEERMIGIRYAKEISNAEARKRLGIDKEEKVEELQNETVIETINPKDPETLRNNEVTTIKSEEDIKDNLPTNEEWKEYISSQDNLKENEILNMEKSAVPVGFNGAYEIGNSDNDYGFSKWQNKKIISASSEQYQMAEGDEEKEPSLNFDEQIEEIDKQIQVLTIDKEILAEQQRLVDITNHIMELRKTKAELLK